MTAQTKVEGSLSASLVKALAEIEGATKDKVNPAFKSKYADLGAVIDAVRPVLARHDLAFTQHSQPSEDGVLVETVLHHISGTTLSLGTLYVPANKRDPQGFGSALSYCRRYSLMTAFGVPAEDDDGNAAAASVRQNGRANGHANGNAKIDDAQFAQLQMLIEQTGTNTKAFCEHFRTPSVKDLPAARFEDAAAALRKKLTTKEPANA